MRKMLLVLLCLAGASHITLAADQADKDFTFAWTLMTDRQDYDDAARKFAQFVKSNPTHPKAPEALSYMGICYQHLTKFGAAADTYARLLAEYPNATGKLRMEAMLNGGHANVRLARYDRAAELYTALLTGFPRDRSAESALFWRGECYARLGRQAAEKGGKAEAWLSKAVEDFSAYIKRYPESKHFPTALANAGFACYDMGAYQKAIPYFQQLARDHAKASAAEDCQLCLAESLYRLNQYNAAREAYADLLKRFPKGRYRSDARSGMAWCDHATKNTLEAAKGFAEAASLAVEDAAALEPQLKAEKDAEQRAQLQAEIKALQDKAIEARHDAGTAFREAGQFDAAVRELAQVAAADNHHLQGEALFQMGAFRLEQAKGAAQAAATTEDADAAKAKRALRRKLTLEAIGYLKKALLLPSLGADAPEAGTFLGEAYLDIGDYKAAALAFGDVARKWPKDERAPWALYHMALSLREQAKAHEQAGDKAQAKANIAEAKEALKKVFMLHPKSRLRLQAAYAMADYQASLGEIDKSRAAYKWIVEQGVAWATNWRGADNRPDEALVEKAEAFAVDSLFRLGESYYPDVDPKRAAEYYKLVVQRHAKSRQAGMAMLRLGELAEAAKQPQEAVRHYSAVLARGKDGVAYKNALFHLGVLQLARGQQAKGGSDRDLLDEARKHFNTFLATYPDDALSPQIHYYRGEALYALAQKPTALNDYLAAYKALQPQLGPEYKGPQDELLDNVLFGLAWCRRDVGDKAGARAVFQMLVDKFPKSPFRADALYVLSLARHEAKDYKGALEYIAVLSREYADNPAAVRAQVIKGRALDDMGRHDEAKAVLQAFLKQHPKHEETPRVLYALSWAWWGIAKPKFEAARTLEKAYREKAAAGAATADAAKAAWEAQLKIARRDEDQMAAVLTRLAHEYASFALIDAVYLRLGEVAYDRQRYEEAMGHYRNALKASKAKDGIADKAQYRIGWCLLRQSEAAQRRAEGEKDATKRSALADATEKKTVAALQAFETLATKYPKSEFAAEGYFRAAELRRQSGDHKGALTEYQRALSRAPKAQFTPAAAYGIGVCRLEVGQNREALEDFKTLLEAFPKSDLVHEANWGAGQACLTLKAYADAREFFEKALADDYAGEAAAKARFGLGVLALEQQQWAKAREEFLKVDAFHGAWKSWAALALLKASRAAEKLDQPEKARKDLEFILRRYPNTPAAQEAKKAFDGFKK